MLAFLVGCEHGGIVPSPASAPDGRAPNVLLIIVDDLRPEIGVYGDAIAHTPNIDKLASDGFVFTNAFAPVPVCGASRAAMLSGRKPTTNRFLSYDARLDGDLPGVASLPGYFKDHGYHTLANGKVFDVSVDSADAWSEPLWNPGGDWASPVERSARREDLQQAYLSNPDGVRGPPFERLDVDDDAYPDGQLAVKTVSDLKRLQDTEAPFFLAVGFRKPHLPFNVPEKYWALYERGNFALPATYRDAPREAPAKAIHDSPELRTYTGIPAQGLLDEHQALELIHGYHAAVSYADAQVGKVLDALEAFGHAGDTIVVLVGDHGWNLGEHTLWTKHSLFDVTLRTPLIVRVPDRPGVRIDAVTDLLDLFPTLAELTGLPMPPDLDGMSLVPVMEDPDRSIRSASFSRWFDGESVRTARYRYTEWRDEAGTVTARMLYDLKVDPGETTNVAGDADYEDVVRELNELITRNGTNVEWSPSIRNSIFYRGDGERRRGPNPVPGEHRPELSGTASHAAREELAELGRIVVADLAGNDRDGLVRRHEQAFGALQAQAVTVLLHPHADVLPKQVSKSRFGEIAHGGDFGHRAHLAQVPDHVVARPEHTRVGRGQLVGSDEFLRSNEDLLQQIGEQPIDETPFVLVQLEHLPEERFELQDVVFTFDAEQVHTVGPHRPRHQFGPAGLGLKQGPVMQPFVLIRLAAVVHARIRGNQHQVAAPGPDSNAGGVLDAAASGQVQRPGTAVGVVGRDEVRRRHGTLCVCSARRDGIGEQ